MSLRKPLRTRRGGGWAYTGRYFVMSLRKPLWTRRGGGWDEAGSGRLRRPRPGSWKQIKEERMKRQVFLLLGVALLMGILLGTGVRTGLIQPKTDSASPTPCPRGTQLIYAVDTGSSITSPALDMHCYNEIRVYAIHYGTNDTTREYLVILQPVPQAQDPPALLELDRFTLGYNASSSKTYSTPGTSLRITLFRELGTFNAGRLFLKVYGNNSPAT